MNGTKEVWKTKEDASNARGEGMTEGVVTGTVLFKAHGCALTERQTESGIYVYTAVNLVTKRHKIISQRKNKLTESGFEAMAARIGELDICVKEPTGVLEMLGAGAKAQTTVERIFKNVLPLYGYNVRANQIALTEHILAVIRRRGIDLAESEVGTGKTHAYLAAAVIAKRGRVNDEWLRGQYPNQPWQKQTNMPVVISTSSIALQKALITDYIPTLSRILVRHKVITTPLTAVVRKGKEHYVCEERLERFYSTADAPTKVLLVRFTGRGARFDLTDADELSSYIKRSICVAGKCSEKCAYRATCRYWRFLQKIPKCRMLLVAS